MQENVTSNTADPIVHLAIGSRVDQNNRVQHIAVNEHPFIGDLQLDSEPDNHALLIAVGEMMGVKRPLSARRITCLGRLAILWLDNGRWLALRAPGVQASLSELFSEIFGDNIEVSEIGEDISVTLNGLAQSHLLEAEHTITFGQFSSELSLNQPILVHPIESEEYNVLVRRACADYLSRWLAPA
ncbi:hypothetical protein [Neptunomonas marina]|uniref:Sarcosine oxidase subunit gamma n=1 Tax=Neptunomonas marina TaxID=1815562 RepID=A0A437QCB2_9GAMM|nr:hypothetical protein [Neptunomonas marina]RVU32198.1 hypothetical protein EOE65_00665 [Neptunomonas marina]